MKKLLLVALVLGLASTAANAGLADWSLETDGSVLYVVGVAGGQQTAAIMFETAALDIDVPQDSGYPILNTDVSNGGSNDYIAGDLAACQVGNISGPGDYFLIAAGVSADENDSVMAGNWFEISVSVDVTGLSQGDTVGSITVYDNNSQADIGTKDITYVPEPATLSLLGLGGLFLARRKKNA